MELRSTTKRNIRLEFRELQKTLCGLGLFEVGMDLEEMRQLLAAWEASVSLNEAGPRSALKHEESAVEFLPKYDAHNSTMISTVPKWSLADALDPQAMDETSFYRRCSLSPFSSPEAPSQRLTVQVEVHHEHEWSPPPSPSRSSSRLRVSPQSNSWHRKRPADGQLPAAHVDEVHAKRSRRDSSQGRRRGSETGPGTGTGTGDSDPDSGVSSFSYAASRGSSGRTSLSQEYLVSSADKEQDHGHDVGNDDDSDHSLPSM